MQEPLGIRRSLTDLQTAYDAGDKLPLETVMRAWKGIKELPPEHPNSFFSLGGFHGEPFRGPGDQDNSRHGAKDPSPINFPPLVFAVPPPGSVQASNYY